MSEPIFIASNHHSDDCGAPPRAVHDPRWHYRGYFENEHGEQTIFLYDRRRNVGVLYMGDAGWRKRYRVVDGVAPGLILNEHERAWLRSCWLAATEFSRLTPESA